MLQVYIFIASPNLVYILKVYIVVVIVELVSWSWDTEYFELEYFFVELVY